MFVSHRSLAELRDPFQHVRVGNQQPEHAAGQTQKGVLDDHLSEQARAPRSQRCTVATFPSRATPRLNCRLATFNGGDQEDEADGAQ